MKAITKAIFTLLLAIAAFTFVSPTPAAYADDCPIAGITRSIPIPASGAFNIADLNPSPLKVDCTRAIRSVVVSLSPQDATGIIDEIKITRSASLNPNDQKKLQEPVTTQFGCPKVKVKNGDDLTLICGGPAVLEPGYTAYQAKGHDFKSASKPKAKINFSVTLSEDYSDQYKKVYGTFEDDTVKSVQDLYGL